MTFPSEFRVWHVEYQKYVNHASFSICGDGNYLIDGWDCNTYTNTYHIELFTGLSDKHGTKVYDGDIIELTYITFISVEESIDIIKDEGKEIPLIKEHEHTKQYEVYWAEGHGGFALKPVNGEPACIFTLEQVKFCKVVGNKHDYKNI